MASWLTDHCSHTNNFVIMSNTDLGNDYVDNAIITFHTCSRCVSWMGDGHTRYLGQVGCRMPILTDNNAKLFQEYTDKGIMKCFRCFNLGQDCCVVSTAGLSGPV
jgi:hypothetical protein